MMKIERIEKTDGELTIVHYKDAKSGAEWTSYKDKIGLQIAQLENKFLREGLTEKELEEYGELNYKRGSESGYDAGYDAARD